MSWLSALFRRIPRYVWISFAAMAAAQVIAYCGAKQLLPYLTLRVLTGPLDERIPFSPPWVTVYLLCFPFWIVSGFLILSAGKPYAYRFTSGYVLSMAVSAAIFLLWPGTLVRPEITGSGLFDRLVQLVYAVDGPTNLCPSLHVMISWFCFRGALDCGKLPRRHTALAFVFFVLVCCSVVLIKQHALIDIPGGILIGELCLQLARLLRLERAGFAIEKRFTTTEKE